MPLVTDPVKLPTFQKLEPVSIGSGRQVGAGVTACTVHIHMARFSAMKQHDRI